MFTILEFAFPWDFFILIQNGDNKRTAIVRYFYSSLVTEHGSLDSHKAIMRFRTDVLRLFCNL